MLGVARLGEGPDGLQASGLRRQKTAPQAGRGDQMSEGASATAGAAGRYATALFELADETGALDRVAGELAALRAAIRDSADFAGFLKSPVISREEQEAAIAAIAAKMGIGAPVAPTLRLMARKRRLADLGATIGGFLALLAKRRGVVSASVVSAQPLTDAQRAALSAAVKAHAGAEIALEETVDAGLIGGLVVRVGSKMIDASIRSKLAQMETMMKGIGR